MKLDDGREVLCTLALPLPTELVGAMGTALAAAAQQAGYTDCSVLLDGTNRVVARRTDRAAEIDTEHDQDNGFDDASEEPA